MKVSEILRLLQEDGWILKRVTGSHRLSIVDRLLGEGQK